MEGRLKVILGVIMLNVTGGALYIWSRFIGPLISAFGYTVNEALWIYVTTISFFCIGIVICTKILGKLGPQKAGAIGGLLFGGGVILAGLSKSVFTLGLSYGVIAGIGSGIMYLVPIATLVKWMPNRKGMANGIGIMAFALSTFVFVPIANLLLGTEPATPEIIQKTFMTMGVIYLVLAIVGSRLIQNPPNMKVAFTEDTDADYPLELAIRTPQFWLLFVLFTTGAMPGVFIISSAAKLGESMAGLTPAQASLSVMALGICNATGRLASGAVADKIGAIRTLRLVFLVSTLSVALLAFVPVTLTTYLIAFIGIVIGYGGTASVTATTIGVVFGPKYYAKNLSYVFLGLAVGAVIAISIKMYGNLELTEVFKVSLVAAIIAFVSSLFVKPCPKRVDIQAAEAV